MGAPETAVQRAGGALWVLPYTAWDWVARDQGEEQDASHQN